MLFRRIAIAPLGLLLLPLLFSSGEAPGQQAPKAARVVPDSAEQMRLSFAPVVKRTVPAVVNINAAKVVNNRSPFMDDPFFRRFFGPQFGMPREQLSRSLGSGVIVDASGLVVTNNHVIDGASEIKVSLADRREFDADVILKDPRTDLAVLRLKADKEQFPVIEFADSDDLQVGDLVLAIGNPFGVGQTVTQGIVSAVARTQVGISDYQFFVQTDAAINPGNSGGPLVTLDGRVAGINTAIFSRSGGSQGIGFAIPSNMVSLVVASARSGGKAVRRPWLGAKLQTITPDIAESLGVARPAGAVVTDVRKEGPAGRAGLRVGDVIVAVDGQAIDDANAFSYRFTTRELGGKAPLSVLRNGKRMDLSVALETAPDRPREEIEIRTRSPFMGLTISNLSPALADELRVDTEAEGIIVTDISEGSVAQNVGFQRGDIIVTVNGRKLARTRDFEDVVRKGSRAWQVTIVRNGQAISARFPG